MANDTGSDNVALERHVYPDPFLDMASTKLPKSFKKLLELCQIFAMTHPQISPIIQRLAEYPITSLVYKADDREIERQHKDIFEKHLRIMEKMIEWGLDHFAYGNAFVSISFPFVRLYRCRVCKTDHQSHEVKYQYLNGRFEGRCKTCGVEVDLEPVDKYVQDPSGINLFRFEPQLITPKFNRVTGKCIYYYDIPPDTKRYVEIGDRDIIDSTPVEYLRCIAMRRKLRLKRVFHFKRPTLSGRDMQWGFPLMLPALKDSYLNQVYKHTDEMVALEHGVPLRVIYPESRTQDPMQKLALGNFRAFMARNIRYWRQDKNAIITSPMPIGVVNIGGDKDMFSTINARTRVVDEIMGAMMVTKGFLLGGENWSSASISQRVMENSFLNYLRRLDTCLQWVRDEVGAFLNLPPCDVSMKPFKKVDDVQMLQVIIGLAREKRVSWEETLSRMDLDARRELEIIERETKDYTQLMLQELLAQNQASAKALVMQTIGQQEAQGAGEVYQQMVQRALGTGAEAQGLATKDQAMQADAEQQAQAQQQDPQAQMMVAKAKRDGAQAQKDQALAQGYEARQQGPQALVNVDLGKQIALWAGELLSQGPDERKRLLAQIHADNPELAQAVVEVAQNMESGGQQTPQGGAMTVARDPASMLRALMAEAKSPQELAQKLMLIEPRQQQQMLLQLSTQNPRLFNMVMKLVNKLNTADVGQSVDMRPLPEQRPPRREESPV